MVASPWRLMALSRFLAQQAQLGELGSHAGATDVEVAGGGGDALELSPDGAQDGVLERRLGTASPAGASPGGQGSRSCSVVDLAGVAEGLQAPADGGGGGAELLGDGAQGGRTAASPAFPPGEQLSRI